MNFILIPKYAEIGVAISVLCSELLVTGMFFYYASKYMKLKFSDFIPIKCLFSSILMGGYLYYMCNNINIAFFVHIIIGVIIYFVALLLMRDSFTIYFKNILLSKRYGK